MKILYFSFCFTALLSNAQKYPANVSPLSICLLASVRDLPNNDLGNSPVCICPMQSVFNKQISGPTEDTIVTYVYKQTAELKILADVYPATGERRPVVVWIHGGALIMGNREDPPIWLLETCRKNE